MLAALAVPAGRAVARAADARASRAAAALAQLAATVGPAPARMALALELAAGTMARAGAS